MKEDFPMKKISRRDFLKVAGISAAAIGLTACGSSSSAASAAAPSTSAASSAAAAAPAGGSSVGVCWYNFADTFIANARTSLDNLAAADGTFTLTDVDSTGDVTVQTSNLSNLYTQGVDYVVLNNINYGAISDVCKQAKDEGVTMVFANTDMPKDEDFANNDALYAVSSRAEESGTIMGETFVEYLKAHPEADRNGDGKINYIMLLGQQGNYDTEMRSSYALKAVKDAGYEMECIGGDIVCEWSRATAQEKVAALLANYSDDIDVIFSCNDDMALGAIEALKAGGFFGADGKTIPVCGVDATAAGIEALKEGTLLVTSLNNPVTLSKAIYKTLLLISEGKEVSTANLALKGASCEDGHRVWLDYTKITKDNIADASYDTNDTAL
jgi:methyl-galactoside transport system substrate-binding protein